MKTYVCTKTWTQMFTAILFLIVKNWKPKCPSIGEWIKKPVQSDNDYPSMMKRDKLLMKQQGWISKTLCIAKEARHKAT